MRRVPITLLLLTASCATGGCASSAAAREAPPWASGDRARGAAADANRAALASSLPALGALQGRVPLVAVSTEPSPDTPAQPRYEIALFDDGTIVYAGHSCVKVAGRLIVRLSVGQLADARAFLASACKDIDSATDDEVCDDRGSVRIACSDGRAILSGSDRCRRNSDVGQRLTGLAAVIAERLGLAAWVGAPTERQACAAGGLDLAAPPLARF
jgi:hypothetical protein